MTVDAGKNLKRAALLGFLNLNQKDATKSRILPENVVTTATDLHSHCEYDCVVICDNYAQELAMTHLLAQFNEHFPDICIGVVRLL